MNIYIEDLISSASFMKFEFGKKIDFSAYKSEIHYNRIGDSEGYYFFDREIDVEITLKNECIDSFDILLNNQENHLYLGHKNSFNFSLHSCKLDDLLFYLNKTSAKWNFNSIIAPKSISIILFSSVQILFYFDFDFDGKLGKSLSLISIIPLQNAIVSR